MKIADLSIRRPVFAIVLIAVFVVVGVFSYPRIGVDLFPNVDFPVITVTVVYPGADPASMESKVADPIEEALNSMSGIKTLRSVNLESVTQVIVEFELSVPTDRGAQDIRDRISSIMRQLPSGIDPPIVQKFDVGAAPIMSVALSGDLPPRELTRIADDIVKERVQRLPGVGAVDLIGARFREIHVLVKPDQLAGLGMTVADVATTLRAQNLELPAGRIKEGARELTVKTKGEVRSVQEIADIIITGQGGAVVRIGDVASVEDSAEEARSSSSMNGKSAVALVIRKQSGGNTVEIAHTVRQELEQLSERVQKAGAHLDIPTDQSTFVEHSIKDVQFDLVFGGILAIIVILFFLHDFRATLISAAAIPTSVVATFAFIDFMGFSFNNMTMLALSLSIGILIDDAIVVLENIYRHRAMGKDPMTAARDGTAEIGLAVMATTASIVAVFLPVAFMKGIIGRFFFQFGLTVSFAVGISLLVSFTLTPMMSSRLLRTHSGESNFIFRAVGRWLDSIDRGYRWLLEKALRYRWTTVAVATASMVIAVFLVTKLKAEFVPVEDRSEFAVNVELPTGTSLDLSTKFTEVVAKDLRDNAPEVAGTFVTVGGGAQGQVNQGNIHVVLTPAKSRDVGQNEIMAWVRRRFADVDTALISVANIGAVSGGGFRPQPVQFNIRGQNLAELNAAADKLVAELQKIPGFVDLDTSYRGGKPEIAIEIDRDRAADLGVPVAVIATTIRALIAGDKISELKDGVDIYDVTMGLPQDKKSGFASLTNLKVRSISGQLVDLASVVQVTRQEGPSQIERQSRQRQVTILANLDGLALGDATAHIDRLAPGVLTDDLSSDYAGMAKIMGESAHHMAVALLLAIIFVYMLLAAQFNSFVHPFTIMLSLPLSMIGAFGALFLADMTLNIFSMIGFIMLMGLVTKNAILLVDYANTLRAQGKGVHEALLEAGPVRLRPILMTTVAMIFGMLPVALAFSEGGATRAPMAAAVIGGLVTSMFLTLLVVPVVYSLADGLTKNSALNWLASKVFVSGNDVDGKKPDAARPAGSA